MVKEISLRQIELLNIVQRAVDDFNRKESYLILRDVSERCICAKFASYLERALFGTEYGNYTVDVEYNRGYEGREESPKMLENKNIVVDLIVHKRGWHEKPGSGNLICIEMKKAYKGLKYDLDIQRLKKMTDPAYGYNYSAGFMVLVVADKKQNRYELAIDKPHICWGAG